MASDGLMLAEPRRQAPGPDQQLPDLDGHGAPCRAMRLAYVYAYVYTSGLYTPAHCPLRPAPGPRSQCLWPGAGGDQVLDPELDQLFLRFRRSFGLAHARMARLISCRAHSSRVGLS